MLAAGLLVASNAPFDTGFARQHGAHLTAQFDGTAATKEQLAATAHAPGVTDAAGPFRILTATARAVRSQLYPDGFPLSPMTIAGRDGAGGAVDQVTLVSGRWATGPGEIVLATGGDHSPRTAPAAVPATRRAPDPDRCRDRQLGQSDRRCLGDAGPARIPLPGGRDPALPDALPLQPRRHRWRNRDRPGVDRAAAPRRRRDRGTVMAGRQTAAGRQHRRLRPFVVAFGVLGLVCPS